MHACCMTLPSNRIADLQARPPSLVEEKEPLQVRIPVRVKRRFKAAAALRGIDPNVLFVEVWEHYERTKASADTAVGK